MDGLCLPLTLLHCGGDKLEALPVDQASCLWLWCFWVGGSSFCTIWPWPPSDFPVSTSSLNKSCSRQPLDLNQGISPLLSAEGATPPRPRTLTVASRIDLWISRVCTCSSSYYTCLAVQPTWPTKRSTSSVMYEVNHLVGLNHGRKSRPTE